MFPLRKYLEPGKFVSFGRYRVTRQIKDNTPITWYVKEVRKDRALLLTQDMAEWGIPEYSVQ